MTDHQHRTPDVPPATTADGAPLDLTAAAALVGAAYAGCQDCQREHAAAVLDGPAEIVAHLAGVAYLGMTNAVAAATGQPGTGIPDATMNRYTRPTRALFRALNRGSVREVDRLTRTMGRAERADVLDDALDLLIGMMSTGLAGADGTAGGG